MNSTKQSLNLECIEVQDQFYENLNSHHTFSVIRQYKNVWEKSSFRKTDHGLLCTPHLVNCFFEFISYTFQRENVKYIKGLCNNYLKGVGKPEGGHRRKSQLERGGGCKI